MNRGLYFTGGEAGFGWGQVSRYVSTAESSWTAHIGSLGDPALAAKSPINAAAAITIPVLIAYGAGDVPDSQSKSMAEALSKAGKPVTVVKLPQEDHWLSRTETRVQLLQALESFLHDHI